jgi:hypothetical protein
MTPPVGARCGVLDVALVLCGVLDVVVALDGDVTVTVRVIVRVRVIV